MQRIADDLPRADVFAEIHRAYLPKSLTFQPQVTRRLWQQKPQSLRQRVNRDITVLCAWTLRKVEWALQLRAGPEEELTEIRYVLLLRDCSVLQKTQMVLSGSGPSSALLWPPMCSRRFVTALAMIMDHP